MDLPLEIFIQIINATHHEYPWQTLQLVHRFKFVNWQFCICISLQTKKINRQLGIPSLHYAAAINNPDKIQKLYLKKNYSLRMPDKHSYSAAAYAVGCESHLVIRRLKVAFALDTSVTTIDKLQTYMRIPFELNLPPKTYTIHDINTAIKSRSVTDLEEILIHSNMYQIIGKALISTPNSPFKDFMMYAYKNYLIHRFWVRLMNKKSILDNLLYSCLDLIDINTQDEHGCTFFHYIAYHSQYLSEFKFFLACANINKRNIAGQSVLHFTIIGNNISAFELLLDMYVDTIINAELILLIMKLDRVEFIRILLQKYKINLRIMLKDTAYASLLHFAADTDAKECMKCLIEDFKLDINVVDNNGSSPLVYTCTKNSIKVMKYLISRGADLMMSNNNGNNPVHVAAIHGFNNCLKLLIKAGSKINLKNNYGAMPLHIAAEMGHLQCMKSLLKSGTDINSKDKYGNGAIHFVSCRGHTKCLKYLIKKNADINLKNDKGNEPLLLAASNDHLDCVNLLITAGAEVNAKNNCGETALHYAASFNSFACVVALLVAGANVNATLNRDAVIESYHYGLFTPLHFAAKKGHLDIIKVLIDYGADESLKTQSGLTATEFL